MTQSTMEFAVEAIKDAADLAQDAGRDLARANGAAKSAGQSSVIDKFSRLAEVKSLVSIAQSLSIIAAISVKTADEAEENRLAALDEGTG